MAPFGVSALEQKNGRCLPRGSYWQMTSLPRLKPTKGFLLASGILFLLVDGLRSSARPGASTESELPSEHQHLETKAAFLRSLLLHLLSAAGPRGEALETVYEGSVLKGRSGKDVRELLKVRMLSPLQSPVPIRTASLTRAGTAAATLSMHRGKGEARSETVTAFCVLERERGRHRSDEGREVRERKGVSFTTAAAAATAAGAVERATSAMRISLRGTRQRERESETHPRTTTLAALTAAALPPRAAPAAAAATTTAPESAAPELRARFAERVHVALALLGAVVPPAAVPSAAHAAVPAHGALLRRVGARLRVARDRVEEGRLRVVVRLVVRRRRDDEIVLLVGGGGGGGSRRRSRLGERRRLLERRVGLGEVELGVGDWDGRGGGLGVVAERARRLAGAAAAVVAVRLELTRALRTALLLLLPARRAGRENARADAVLATTATTTLAVLLLLLLLAEVGARHVLGELLDVGRLLLGRGGGGGSRL